MFFIFFFCLFFINTLTSSKLHLLHFLSSRSRSLTNDHGILQKSFRHRTFRHWTLSSDSFPLSMLVRPSGRHASDSESSSEKQGGRGHPALPPHQFINIFSKVILYLFVSLLI